jgi:hypothetical protein
MAAFIHPLHEFLKDHPESQEVVSYKTHCQKIFQAHAEWNAFMKTWELDKIGEDELL